MYREVAEREEIYGGELPAVGNSPHSTGGRNTTNKDGKGKYRIRYFVANMSDEGDLLQVEALMSSSVSCGDKPAKPGDVMVIKEETNFDREGNYNLLIKYMELAEDSDSYEKELRAQQDAEESQEPAAPKPVKRKRSSTKKKNTSLEAGKQLKTFEDTTPPSPDEVLVDDTPALVPVQNTTDESDTGAVPHDY